MIEGRRSGTALRVAMRRAAHQLYDQPLIFPDPLALRILGDEVAAQVREKDDTENQPAARALRIFLAVRSRFAEEELAKAVEEGVRQYVVLGAGLDTFAYRNPWPGLLVFEVDHPDTQAWKREQLHRAGIAIPESMRYAPVDFERDTLAHGLDAVGFRRDQPAFFSWLGVVPYLTRDAAFATLEFIAGLPVQSGVVFDYSIPREMMSEAARQAFEMLAERVARAGEPFRLFFDPAQLGIELRGLGFRNIEDMDSVAIRQRWQGEAVEQQRVDSDGKAGRSGRIVCARL